MAALLDATDVSHPDLHRGDIIEGVIVGHDRNGLLVDIGAKSEGIIPFQEMHCLQPEGPSRLKEGEQVLVFVLQPETVEGQIILSLDRARGEMGWRLLQEYYEEGTAIEAYISGYNRGGLLVNVEGVSAFVPLSQLGARPERGSGEGLEKALAAWVGKPIMLKVIELSCKRARSGGAVSPASATLASLWMWGVPMAWSTSRSCLGSGRRSRRRRPFRSAMRWTYIL